MLVLLVLLTAFGFKFRSKIRHFYHKTANPDHKTGAFKERAAILEEFNEISEWMKYQSNSDHVDVGNFDASTVSFDGMKHKFIATNSPEAASLDNFWQMVIEKDVKIIVMLNSLHEYDRFSEYDAGHFFDMTKREKRQKYLPVYNESFDLDEESRLSCTSLPEGSTIRESVNKGQYHYWPREENEVRELKNGISLKLLNTQKRGSINLRFVVASFKNDTLTHTL